MHFYWFDFTVLIMKMVLFFAKTLFLKNNRLKHHLFQQMFVYSLPSTFSFSFSFSFSFFF